MYLLLYDDVISHDRSTKGDNTLIKARIPAHTRTGTMDWNTLQNWGDLARNKFSEVADAAQTKMNEAAGQISARTQPPLEIGNFRVQRLKLLAEVMCCVCVGPDSEKGILSPWPALHPATLGRPE